MNKIFGKTFQPKKIIDNPSDESLREWALQHGGGITEFGNLSVITRVRHRMAKLTEVIMGDPDPDDLELIGNVLDYLKGKEMIAKDKIIWRRDDFWGYEVPSEIPGVELERFEPRNYYSDEQIERLSYDLKRERLDWLSQFPTLNQDIVNIVRP